MLFIHQSHPLASTLTKLYSGEYEHELETQIVTPDNAAKEEEEEGSKALVKRASYPGLKIDPDLSYGMRGFVSPDPQNVPLGVRLESGLMDIDEGGQRASKNGVLSAVYHLPPVLPGTRFESAILSGCVPPDPVLTPDELSHRRTMRLNVPAANRFLHASMKDGPGQLGVMPPPLMPYNPYQGLPQQFGRQPAGNSHYHQQQQQQMHQSYRDSHNSQQHGHHHQSSRGRHDDGGGYSNRGSSRNRGGGGYHNNHRGGGGYDRRGDRDRDRDRDRDWDQDRDRDRDYDRGRERGGGYSHHSGWDAQRAPDYSQPYYSSQPSYTPQPPFAGYPPQQQQQYPQQQQPYIPQQPYSGTQAYSGWAPQQSQYPQPVQQQYPQHAGYQPTRQYNLGGYDATSAPTVQPQQPLPQQPAQDVNRLLQHLSTLVQLQNLSSQLQQQQP